MAIVTTDPSMKAIAEARMVTNSTQGRDASGAGHRALAGQDARGAPFGNQWPMQERHAPSPSQTAAQAGITPSPRR